MENIPPSQNARLSFAGENDEKHPSRQPSHCPQSCVITAQEFEGGIVLSLELGLGAGGCAVVGAHGVWTLSCGVQVRRNCHMPQAVHGFSSGHEILGLDLPL